MIYVDCSDSMATVVEGMAAVADTVQTILASQGVRCVIITGGNGGIEYLSERPGKWENIWKGESESWDWRKAHADKWTRLLVQHDPSLVMLLADSDGLPTYEAVAQGWTPWSARTIQFHPHGSERYGVRVPARWAFPWRVIAGVNDVQQLVEALDMVRRLR